MAFATEPTRSLLRPARRRWPALRRRWLRFAAQLPIVPLAILVPFVLVAAFAPAIAPYDPTEPIPGAGIFDPPFWVEGANPAALLGTDFQGRDVLSRLIYGARVSLIVGVMGTIVAGGIGTTLGHPGRLSRRLGGSGDHARDRRLAGAAGAGLRDLPRDDGRPQHVEHHHHPRRGVLDALRPGDPRRGAEPARARVRQAGRDRRRLVAPA